MRKLVLSVVLICLSVLPLSACGGKGSDAASKAVEDYLSALVAKDSSKLSALSCASWEQNAQMELDSLQAVQARLEGLSCATSSSSGGTSQVNCKGKIVATYNGEDQTLDVSTRTYQVVNQGGDYLVCGYK